MGVENQRPEDIKVAGRESWTNCECRMLEHSILSGSRNVGGMSCHQTWGFLMQMAALQLNFFMVG